MLEEAQKVSNLLASAISDDRDVEKASKLLAQLDGILVEAGVRQQENSITYIEGLLASIDKLKMDLASEEIESCLSENPPDFDKAFDLAKSLTDNQEIVQRIKDAAIVADTKRIVAIRNMNAPSTMKDAFIVKGASVEEANRIAQEYATKGYVAYEGGKWGQRPSAPV